MAKNDKNDKPRVSGPIIKLAKSVQSNLDKLYQNTYYSSNSNLKDLNTIKANIDKSIDNIITNNINNVGIPNISKLYLRLKKTQGDKSIAKNITDLFDDRQMMDTILSTYMQNTYLKDMDNEIDVVCKYMPKLLEALDTRKDNVLSADHFSKDFITICNSSNVSKENTFNDRINTIKKKYKLAELLEDTYDRASKYGEEFIYIVPYKKALAKLLKTKGGTTMTSKMNMEQATIVTESGIEKPFQMAKPDFAITEKDKALNINIELEQSNMIVSLVQDRFNAVKKKKTIHEQSLNEGTKIVTDGNMMDDLDYSEVEKDDKTNDGLITQGKDDAEKKLDIPGCIVKRIDRSHIIPIYIEDIPLGYYYLEFKDSDEITSDLSLTDPIMGLKANSARKLLDQPEQVKRDQMLRYISGQLSSFIDSKFINANQDLSKEIYMILKHNDIYNTPSQEKLKVTFLPPEDVVHVYFKKDERTHRGISDLARALFPAKLYGSLYVTNTLTILTRGQDKRVYYVKQNIETNIAKVLLNTIEQIKKSNFGIRQIENMNHILNITGKFNDYVIPVGANGDSPVQFEVMQGQNVEIKTELMNMLEEMAINSTDVPLELIQARQSIDYAVQLTMTNSKFLRKVYNRQARFESPASDIITKIYNAEFEEDDELTINLPPPMFLNITNTNQIMDNTNQLVESVTDMEMAEEQDDELKAIFKRNLKRHYLGSFIDLDVVERIKNKSKQEQQLKKGPQDQQEQQ